MISVIDNAATATGWISLGALAAMLGSEQARTARDWCKRHKIDITPDGGFRFVRIADVRAVLERLATTPTTVKRATNEKPVDPDDQVVAFMRRNGTQA